MDSRDDIPVLIQHPAELQQGFYLLTNDLNIIKSRMSEASEVIAEVSTTIAPEMAASAGQSDSVNRDISTNSSPPETHLILTVSCWILLIHHLAP